MNKEINLTKKDLLEFLAEKHNAKKINFLGIINDWGEIVEGKKIVIDIKVKETVK